MFPRRSLIIVLILYALSGCSHDSGNVMPLSHDFNDDDAKLAEKLLAKPPQLLELQDYDGLDVLYQKYKAMPLFPSGVSPLYDFYRSLCSINNGSPADYEKRLVALNKWCAARPNSGVALEALAGTYFEYARNGGTDQNLDDHCKVTLFLVPQINQDAHWYERMAQVMAWTGDDRWKTIVDIGISKFPDYEETYFQGAFFREPRWGGSNLDSEAFIAKEADRVGGANGDILYARLTDNVWINNFDQTLYTERHFSWPRSRDGMLLMCNQYPHSAHLVNMLAALASSANQPAYCASLLDLLGPHYVSDDWPDRKWFDQISVWAHGNK